MTKKQQENVQVKPLSPIVRAMAVGDVEVYPIARMAQLKTVGSTLGAILDRQYSTKSNREERTVSITRIR